MLSSVMRILRKKMEINKTKKKLRKIKRFKNNGLVPWSEGYDEYKWQQIDSAINDEIILEKFRNQVQLKDYGIAIDERIVEYPWIFSNLVKNTNRLLDAGSTFNYEIILKNELVLQKEKTILTYFPETASFNKLRISYIYSDLRDIPIRDNYFEEIVCQSTIEHIDMDNSIYGYKSDNTFSNKTGKNYEYIIAIKELIRVLKNNGTLLLTFPYGKYENHGFFQQFDEEMTTRIISELKDKGDIETTFFKYTKNGWIIANQLECDLLESFNPHTGIGKGIDNAAHCRGVCCIKFLKNN